MALILFGADRIQFDRIAEADRRAARSAAAHAKPNGGKGSPAMDAGQEIRYLQALGYVEFDPDAATQLRGVTHVDRARVAPGYGLFTDSRRTAYLIDTDANIIHQWDAPESIRNCEFAQLLDDGLLAMLCVNRGVIFLDWESHVVTRVSIHAHHEIEPWKDDQVLIPVAEFHDLNGQRTVFDAIYSLSEKGEAKRLWQSWEALDELRDHQAPHPLDQENLVLRNVRENKPWLIDDDGKGTPVFNYYHMNSIQVLPESPLGRRDRRFRAGNLLISLRNANLIAILDQDNYHVLWSWGPGELELQHTPRMLPNGHIIIMDNGLHRGWSRAVELDPERDEIVWEYRSSDFFTPTRGNVQRLENGNTLICEAEKGRAFEVTPDREIVWEFWNWEITQNSSRRLIYRFSKLPEQQVSDLVRGHGTIIRHWTAIEAARPTS